MAITHQTSERAAVAAPPPPKPTSCQAATPARLVWKVTCAADRGTPAVYSPSRAPRLSAQRDRCAAVHRLRRALAAPIDRCHHFHTAWDNKCHLVLEAWLCAQQGHDVGLDGPGKRRVTVGLQLQGHCASTQSNLRGCCLRGAMADNPAEFRKPVE